MTILQGIGAANALIRGAASLVREIKQPKVDNGAFAALMQAQMRSPETIEAQIVEKTEDFMRVRDADANGLLSRDESGLASKVFERLDTDADGQLSLEELQRPYLDALHRDGRFQ